MFKEISLLTFALVVCLAQTDEKIKKNEDQVKDLEGAETSGYGWGGYVGKGASFGYGNSGYGRSYGGYDRGHGYGNGYGGYGKGQGYGYGHGYGGHGSGYGGYSGGYGGYGSSHGLHWG